MKLDEAAEGKISESREDSSPRKNLGELEEALWLVSPLLLDIEDR